MRALLAAAITAIALAACGSGGDSGSSGNASELSSFATARIAIDGVPFEVWLADSEAEQRRGFMSVDEEDIAPLPDGTPRGMLFRYPSDRRLSFWMRDTVVPLDLAYATSDGRVVEVHHLVPLDEVSVVAQGPVRYAFEAVQGTFARHGIGIGDRIALP